MSPQQVRSIGMRIQDKVRTHFGWSLTSDQNSAQSLLEHVQSHSSTISIWSKEEREQSILELQERIFLGPIAAVGAAVDYNEILEALESEHRFIFADGALGIIEEFDENLQEEIWMRTLALVTDADGHPYISKAIERKVLHILHAHGDNQEDWNNLLKKISQIIDPPRLILTHQTPDRIDGMLNPGGFTDGDRTICLIGFLGIPIQQITLLGFRSDIVGRWSGSTDPKRKLRKLKFMQEVIDGLIEGGMK